MFLHMVHMVHMVEHHHHMTVVVQSHKYFPVNMRHQAYKMAMAKTDSTAANIRMVVLHAMVLHTAVHHTVVFHLHTED